MFFRLKPSGERRYLQIVENTRDGAATRQRVLATLGRIEDLEASGKLDALPRSGARFSETALLISSLQAGTLEASATARIGAPMIFGRLWEQTGCAAVIEHLAAGRGFGFSLERAVFASVLHRLTASGSDRACDAWLDAYHIPGADALALHQFYRAMAWLGETLADQNGATRAPRRSKDLIEEALFERRRNLFTDLSVVLFDTTSLMFTGTGGESLGQHGVSKDHRPDLRQVVVGVVLDEAGRPICSETWPGNATDVKALLPIVTRLRDRFGIRRMCVVADRGMISADTIAELEARGIDYILGARERSTSEVREVVLADRTPMVPLTIFRERAAVRSTSRSRRWSSATGGRGCSHVATWSVSIPPRRAVMPQRGKRRWQACARSCKPGIRNWLATLGIVSSSPHRGRGISRSMPSVSPTTPGSTDCMCCAPTAP